MTLLGELHNQGLGIRQDPHKAAEWYRLAGRPRRRARARRARPDGDRRARHGARPCNRGSAWLEAAAAKGEPAASYNLALLLLGERRRPSRRRARRGAAARRREGRARRRAARARGALSARARRRPRHGRGGALAAQAADNGNPAGEVEYAILLFNGDGVAADEGVAARYFRRAAGQGQRHRPEPPGAPLRRRPRRAAEPRRGGERGIFSPSRKAATDAWLDSTLRTLSVDDRTKAERLAAERAGRT